MGPKKIGAVADCGVPTAYSYDTELSRVSNVD